MAFRASIINVGTTPTSLVIGTDDDSVTGFGLLVKNTGSVEVRLGGPTVTFATGYPLLAGDPLAVDNDSGAPLYAVVASGTSPVNVLLSNV